jgi:hypothetical protein
VLPGPNDAAEKIVENGVPIEHDPQAAMALSKQTSHDGTNRGLKSYVQVENAENMNSLTVFFAGGFNMIGCLWNVIF